MLGSLMNRKLKSSIRNIIELKIWTIYNYLSIKKKKNETFKKLVKKIVALFETKVS